MRHHQLLHGQFARVVKGVDLRSTAGNCAWAQTPQLTQLTTASAPGHTSRCQQCSQNTVCSGNLRLCLSLALAQLLVIISSQLVAAGSGMSPWT